MLENGTGKVYENEQKYRKAFTTNFKRMLKEQGLSQKDLAERTGLSDSIISNYINGEKLPGTLSIIKICKVLDCSADDLIEFGIEL